MGTRSELPLASKNNFWWRNERNDTAIVFVHGVLSDSRSCWLAEPDNISRYWPHIVCEDNRFDNCDIFLGGYYTSVDAGIYDVRSSSDELRSSLQRRESSNGDSVLDRNRIIFICHSTGGVVARYLLVHHYSEFSSKKIGLVLIASPSHGSDWAGRLSLLISIYGHCVGQQLQTDSWSLVELDSSFKRLVVEKRIPQLSGIEACENHFIFHRKWLPNRKVIVTEKSAGVYFGPVVVLRDTDHFTSVKPIDRDHPAHELIVDFFQSDFAESGERNVTLASAPCSFVKMCATIRPFFEENRRIFDAFGPNSGGRHKDEPVRYDLKLWYSMRPKLCRNNSEILKIIKECHSIIPLIYIEDFEKWISHIEAFEAHVGDERIDYREHQFPHRIREIIENAV